MKRKVYYIDMVFMLVESIKTISQVRFIYSKIHQSEAVGFSQLMEYFFGTGNERTKNAINRRQVWKRNWNK